MATEATVASGRYPAAIALLDAGVEVTQVACPELVPLIQAGDIHGEELHGRGEALRRAAASEAGVDTVILGCTHYPLIRPMLQRIFGRGVTLITSAEEIAREVARHARPPRRRQRPGREGDYRFLCTGDEAGVPRGGGPVPAAAADRGRAGRPGRAGGGCVTPGRRPRGRRAAADRDRPRTSSRSATGSVLFEIGHDPADLHGDGRGDGAAVDARPGHRLGDVRVRDAARIDRPAEVARRLARQAGRPHGRDPAADRPLAALGGRLRGARRAHGVDRLRRHPGRRRHALRRDLRRLPGAAHGAVRPGRPRRCCASCRCATRSPRCRWASSTASRCSTCAYVEDCAGRGRHERGHGRRRAS